MKKIISYLIIASFALSVNAQSGERLFKRFKGDVSPGIAIPSGSNSDVGILFALEPKFALMDQLAVGLRIEGAVMAKFTGDDNGNVDLDNGKVVGSYLATVDYYFTNKYGFRPFVGAGAGIFSLADSYESFDSRPVGTKFGGMIRAGAELKHFRFGLEYNIIPRVPGSTTLTNVKYSYIGVKFGVCFGGGPL